MASRVIDAFFSAFPDGRHLFFWQDEKKTLAEIAKFSECDAVAFPKYEAYLERLAVIVEQLLEMVRQINAEGTAVVLVEQSVNIALSLVEHAYFMEKGEIRFDGPARELLQRDDLVRAVFLRGAAAAG